MEGFCVSHLYLGKSLSLCQTLRKDWVFKTLQGLSTTRASSQPTHLFRGARMSHSHEVLRWPREGDLVQMRVTLALLS